MKVPSTSNQPPPSFPKLIPLPEGPGLRTCASEQPSVTFGRTKTISFAPEGVDLRVCAPGLPFVTFGLQKAMSFVPKVKVFEFVLLSVHPIPSAMLGFLSLGPANELGSISEGEGLTRRSNPQQYQLTHVHFNRHDTGQARLGDLIWTCIIT